jgi:hypothetical protein
MQTMQNIRALGDEATAMCRNETENRIATTDEELR